MPMIGMPISMGRLEGKKREVAEFGLEANKWTHGQLGAGIPAAIAKKILSVLQGNNYQENYLPCHGLGMIEVEKPWMETSSDYILKPDITFQIDTFVSTNKFRIRG